MSDLLTWAERFIATPSVSRDGNAAIAALARELLRELRLEARVDRVRDRGVPQQNLIVEAGGPGDGGLLLVTHLDTVPPGDPTRWTATGGDPFRPTRDGDRLYGLGAADAKVDFVCKAMALASLTEAPLRRRVRMVGTFAEEIGLRGARRLVASGGTRGVRWALVGEPSELVAIHAHKGYAVYDAHLPALAAVRAPRARRVEEEVSGVAAHSSTPALGRNAIEAALERLAAPGVVGLDAIEGGEQVNQVPAHCRLAYRVKDAAAPQAPERIYAAAPLVAFLEAWRGMRAELEEIRDTGFEPDHSVTNLGRIRLEDGHPVVRFDIRPVPGVDPHEAVKRLRDVARIECDRFNPALATPPHSALLRALGDAQEALGIGRRSATKATCTEAGVLAEAGLEAVVFGAGRSVGNVHRPNEHTSIAELSLARDAYAHVIRSLCGEPT